MSRMILPEHIFAVVTGLTDGILTALTLGAGRIVASTEPITIGLAFRISIASSLSGVFVFFTADYIRQRRQLVYFERQLSLMSKNHLAATRLGQAARSDSMRAAAISSICNLLGALLPLITGALLPRFSWLAIAIALVALSVLGVTAARSLYGNPILWAAVSTPLENSPLRRLKNPHPGMMPTADQREAREWSWQSSEAPFLS